MGKKNALLIIVILFLAILSSNCKKTPLNAGPEICTKSSLHAGLPASGFGVAGQAYGDYVIDNQADYINFVNSGQIVPVCVTCMAMPDFSKKMIIAVSGGVSTCGSHPIRINSITADCRSITVNVMHGEYPCPPACPACPCITVISYPGFMVELDKSGLPVHFEHVACLPDPDTDGDGVTDYQEMFADNTDPFDSASHI